MSKIHIIDDLSPEDGAMLQSLYSRSPKSVVDHLEKVKKAGSGKFMDQYYVGYGHKSIGDCGTTSIFIEGVSMLAAKAIQDWPLYNGQEASTRYMDFSNVGFSYETEEEKNFQLEWMGLYNEAKIELTEKLKLEYPIQDGDDPKVYNNAINAKVFDVARGLLPAGTHTNLSWHTNLRQAFDRLVDLFNHPLKEVSNLAKNIFSELAGKYPHSFGFELSDEQEKYNLLSHAQFTYKKEEHFSYTLIPEFDSASITHLDIPANLYHLIENRPRKTQLHRGFERFGNIYLKFKIDFGSYRDLQRHRNCIINMPLLEPTQIHPWYFDQYSENLRKKIKNLLCKISTQDETFHRQYICPMGSLVDISLTMGLPEAIYIAELRSGLTVHATLRPVARQIGLYLKEYFPRIALYVNFEKDQFSIKRGRQTINEKTNE